MHTLGLTSSGSSDILEEERFTTSRASVVEETSESVAASRKTRRPEVGKLIT